MNKQQGKLGRNDPCPCGSGKKFKKCHGSSGSQPKSSPLGISDNEVNLKIVEMQAMMAQREKQQGRGRPIISSPFKGYRFIAVGERLFFSNKWETFHDFLLAYIKDILGAEWGGSKLKKPFDDRHPILQWHELVCKHQQTHFKNAGVIQEAPMTGAVAAYLGLAYNLYLLGHNIKIQSTLVDRLKDRKQFNGAYYETYVAATFIKAGFDLEFENEQDISTSHCEFTATSRDTGHKYSVEAKAREPYKTSANVGDQLYEALKKNALYKRIVFIDVNVSEDADKAESLRWVKETVATLRQKESSMTIRGLPAPEAYIFLTNHPYLYKLERGDFNRAVLGEGFKIPDFSIGAVFNSIREARESRDRHSHMFRLMDSVRVHYEIPATFDGEIPEFAFGEISNRLRIGQSYSVPDEDGKETVGELEDAIVSENERAAYCVYKVSDGRRIIVTSPLTDKELSAYRRHPDTFFGVMRQSNRRTDDPLDLYDMFYSSYHHTPKERLLEFVKDHPQYGQLIDKSQEELAVLYCESVVEEIIKRKSQSPMGE